MKIRFNRMFSILCAVVLLICAVSVWAAAENTPATPTDLTPVENEETPAAPEEEPKEPEQEPEKETEKEPEKEQESEDEPEEAIASVEIVITKTLTINQSWEGKMGKTKPAVLKLDLNRAGSVYMVIEGKDVWATVEKADRVTENPPRIQDESGLLVYRWEAEAGSYLITLGPVEPNLLAMATVNFMDTRTYEAWEEERKETEPEPETEETEQPEEEKEPEGEPEAVPEPAEEENKPEEETATEPEEEQLDENRPESENAQRIPDQSEDRKVDVTLTWDDEFPILGDTAHLNATLYGYEGLEYSLQWQSSPDKETWDDVPDATDLSLDVIVTAENNHYYWRLVVYLEDESEE